MSTAEDATPVSNPRAQRLGSPMSTRWMHAHGVARASAGEIRAGVHEPHAVVNCAKVGFIRLEAKAKRLHQRHFGQQR